MNQQEAETWRHKFTMLSLVARVAQGDGHLLRCVMVKCSDGSEMDLHSHSDCNIFYEGVMEGIKMSK